MSSEDCREKLWAMIKDCRFAMLVTVEGDGALRSRPMTSVQKEFDGSLWFFASAQSPAVAAIAGHADVCLAYADADAADFVSISGTASVEHEIARKQALWNPIVQAWFPQGAESSDVVLIRVAANHAEYWDANSSKLVELYSLASALIKGTTPKHMGEHRHVAL
jgi:general stress protein 26